MREQQRIRFYHADFIGKENGIEALRESQFVEERNSCRGDEFAAHLAARERRLLRHHDVSPGTREQQRRGGAGGPAADDEHVRPHRASR